MMLNDYTQYLLWTDSQIAEFRARYAGYIARQGDAFVQWISSWPAREWMDFLSGVPEQNIPIVIGTICVLHNDRRIRIEFNDSATLLRRCWTDREREEFWGIDRH